MEPTGTRLRRHKPRWRQTLAATLGAAVLLGGAILGGVGALGASAAEGSESAVTASASPSASNSAVSASPSASPSLSAEQSSRDSVSGTTQNSQTLRTRSTALSCAAGNFYTIDSAGNVYGLTSLSNTPSAVATSTGIRFGEGSGTFNGLAIGASGASAYAFNRAYSGSSIAIYAWTPSGTRTWTGALPGKTGLSYSSLIAGGVSPVDSSGKYYFGGYTSTDSEGTRFQLFSYSYDESTQSSSVTYVGYVQITSDLNASNGDLAFDSKGNLYLLWNNASAGKSRIISVEASELQNHQLGQPLSAGHTKTISSVIGSQYNGLAFNNTGAVFIQYSTSSSTYVAAINPDTGEYVSSVIRLSEVGQGVDLASCQTPPTIQSLRKDVVGRVVDTDQFALSITREGQSDATATATTSGNKTGIQSEVAGPIVAQAGATYLLEETGAGAPNALLSNYASTLSCVDTANNNSTIPVTPVNGSTTKYSMIIPTSSLAAAVVCTFRNTPTSGSVTWTKTDASGVALGGSVWGLSETNGSDPNTEKTVEDNTGQSGYTGLDTDPAAGKFTVVGLPLGTYSLRETAAPQGYQLSQLSQEPHPFTLTESAPNYRFTTEFVNTQALGSATWTKTDSSGHELAGSEWTLTFPDDSKKVVTDNTGQSGYTGLDTNPAPGKFHVIDLSWGQYSLAESKAPVGYLVSETATAAFTVDASHLEHALGTFKNPAITTPALPLTGGLGTDRFLFAGMGILLLAVLTGGTALLVRRRALH